MLSWSLFGQQRANFRNVDKHWQHSEILEKCEFLIVQICPGTPWVRSLLFSKNDVDMCESSLDFPTVWCVPTTYGCDCLFVQHGCRFNLPTGASSSGCLMVHCSHTKQVCAYRFACSFLRVFLWETLQFRYCPVFDAKTRRKTWTCARAYRFSIQVRQWNKIVFQPAYETLLLRSQVAD